MTTEPNIGQSFPLEKLASDIARNEFNYQAILNGLILWDKTDAETVTLRLAKDVSPFFHQYTIPSRKSLEALNTPTLSIQNLDLPEPLTQTTLDIILYGGKYKSDLSVHSALDKGFMVTFNILVTNNPGSVPWNLYYVPLVVDWSPNREYRYPNFVRDPDVPDLVYRVNVPLIEPDPGNQAPSVDVARYGSPLTEDEVLTPIPIPTVGDFTESFIAKWTAPQDVSQLVLKTTSTDPVDETDITVKVHVRPQ